MKISDTNTFLTTVQYYRYPLTEVDEHRLGHEIRAAGTCTAPMTLILRMDSYLRERGPWAQNPHRVYSDTLSLVMSRKDGSSAIDHPPVFSGQKIENLD